MNTVIQKYGVGIFSFVIAVLTAVQLMSSYTLVDILQLAVIIVTAVTSFLLPLLDAGWRGALKTGFDVLGVALLLVIPYALTGHITGAQIVLVAVGVIKALATELGVYIRVDPSIPTPVVVTGAVYPPNVATGGVAEAVKA